MIADSVKHIVHALVSAVLLNRRIGGYGSQRLLATIGKTALAALVMGLAALIAEPALEQLIGRTTLLRELALVTVSGGLSVLVFALMASLLRIEELGWMWGMLRQKLGR